MTHDELIAFTDKFFHECLALLDLKNSDYANNDDAFSGLRLADSLGICSVEDSILVRMADKLSRLAHASNNRTLALDDEKIEDTLRDLANYCVLLAAYRAHTTEEAAVVEKERMGPCWPKERQPHPKPWSSCWACRNAEFNGNNLACNMQVELGRFMANANCRLFEHCLVRSDK